MKLSIKATNLELTPSLNTYIENKIGSLSRLVERFDEDDAVSVYLEVGRTTRHHKKGPVYRAEADVRLPGKVLRAEEENYDLRAAIDILKDKLRIEIDKYRDRTLGKSRKNH